MSLKILAGNRMEALVDAFLQDFPPPTDPFLKRVAVVQNRGMERHLRMEMARRHGVCCGMDFPFPVTLAYRLFAKLIPNLPREDDSSQTAMTWRIVAALDRLPKDGGEAAVFAPVLHYLADRSPLKAWQLAREIARTFDRYQIFRPDMVRSWEVGNLEGIGQHETWQAALWRDIWQNPGCHRARARELFLEALDRPEAAKALPASIAFFAVASLPRYYTDLFTAVARHASVTFYLLEPGAPAKASAGAHAESELSWNTAGADYRARLAAAATYNGTNFLPPSGDRVLDLVHQDLFGTPASPELWHKAMDTDATSVQIHCCHGVVRELEVLEDILLDILQTRRDIEPHDILVMLADPGSRSGYVRAVFESATPPDRRIPLRIVTPDRSEPEPVIETFFRILALPLERFNLASLLSLLECQAIRSRFKLETTDRDWVSNWFCEAGARWGIDGDQKQELGLPALHDYTWSHAAGRLILGYALPEDHHQLFEGVAPLDAVEGTGAAILGRFLEFVSTLIAVLAPIDKPGTMPQWRDRLCAILETMFAGPDAEACTIVEQSLTIMAYEAGRADCTALLDLQTATEALRERLDMGSTTTGILSGAVTFSDMQTLRGVPFKVVAIVGLDDGIFPGQDRRPGFDLMQAAPYPGDPKQRADDRRLFLEAVLSARDILIVTYRGRTQEENAPLPPSVVVSELLDLIDSRTRVKDALRPSDRLVRNHRLQAFHSDYFRPGGDPCLFSYSAENCQCARGGGQGGTPFVMAALPDRPDLLPDPLDLDLLRRFLENPCRFFLEKRLGVSFPWDTGLLEIIEPLDGLNGLERYQCRQEVLEALLAGSPIDPVTAYLQNANCLPPGAPGLSTLQDIRDTTLALRDCIDAACDGAAISSLTAAVVVPLTKGAITIQGSIQGVLPNRIVRWRPGTIRPKDQLAGWLDHVFLHAAGCGLPETLLIGTKGRYRFLPPAKPLEILSSLLAIFLRGIREPVPFFPKTSKEFARTVYTEKPTAAAVTAAQKAWQDNKYPPIDGEGRDRHFAKCFPDANHLWGEDFQNLASAIFHPLLQHVEDLA